MESKNGNVVINGVETNESERQKCEIWTRVMGYYRPTSFFNPGKQSEQKERLYFLESQCPCCRE